jgi:hypothetical protein
VSRVHIYVGGVLGWIMNTKDNYSWLCVEACDKKVEEVGSTSASTSSVAVATARKADRTRMRAARCTVRRCLKWLFSRSGSYQKVEA